MELFLGLVLIGAVVVGFIQGYRRPKTPPREPHPPDAPVTVTFSVGTVGSRRQIQGWKFVGELQPLTVESAVLDTQIPTQVPSASEPGRYWTVDLAARRCSCPDFAKRRDRHPPNDVRRFCKHALAVLESAGLLQRFHPLARAVLTSERATRYDVVHRMPLAGVDVALAFTTRGDWVNLYAPTAVDDARARIAEYGYSLREKRWAGRDTPRHLVGASVTIRDLFEPIRR